MINVLSYIGMNMQSEVCLWTLVGLVRTIFDATLFKVNANLKQVWQMTMPGEISLPVQRVLRTMISGVMLVQCFTVYVYLASYIVLLYPVFLEERPTLVLPWLLLAAIRQLLCELTSLALGLGTCVLLGPARPPCIKFVIVKLVSIMPAFYMWMLVFSYYHILKVAAAFKTFPVVLQPSDHDYGLELAIRRRRTKSLLGEDQLRCKLVASLYGERSGNEGKHMVQKIITSNMTHSTNTSYEDIKAPAEIIHPLTFMSNRVSDTGSYEDWYGNDFAIPRDADRILEQFVLMLLRIGAHIEKEGDSTPDLETFKNKSAASSSSRRDNINNCTTIPPDDTDTPPQVGSKGNTASYVRDYPKIFRKKTSENPVTSEIQRTKSGSTRNIENQMENDNNGNVNRTRERKRTVLISPNEKNISQRKSASQVVQRNNFKQPSTSTRSSQATPQSKDKSSKNAKGKHKIFEQKKKEEPQNNLTTLKSKDSISFLSLDVRTNAPRNNQNDPKEEEPNQTNSQFMEDDQSSTNSSVNDQIAKKPKDPESKE